MPATSEPYVPPVTRVIDFRIPLPYLISGFCALAFTLVSMYFSMNQLLRDVGDLQITVKAGNTQSIMSIPRSTAPTMSSGLPTPIR